MTPWRPFGKVFKTSAYPDPNQKKKKSTIVPEQCVDGHFFPRDALPQHVIGEGRQAEQRLQDGVHVTSVAQVGESAIEVRTQRQQLITWMNCYFKRGPGF